MSALPSPRALVLLLAVAVVATITVGSLALVRGVQGEEVRPLRRETAEQTQTQRLDHLAPGTEQVTDFGQGGPGITPTPPRVLAIAGQAVPKETRFALARLEHVEKVMAVDAGAVTVAGTGLNLLAVDPSEFRSWTPKAVADQPAVWSAIARGELVADTKAARRLGMVLGAEYQVDSGPRLRLAASARLGLTGVDGIVSVETGRSLGLLQGVAVLLHGRKAIGTAGVRKVLGAGAQVVSLGGESRTPDRKVAVVGRPDNYLDLYKASATRCPGLSWTVLAAIGQVESSHGRNNGPSSAGALGPMQFMPATWKHYGVDGDGDGKADIWSPYDAVPGAANYLCANGAGQGGEKLRKSIWFYNHSWDYVNKVMGLADAYARAYA